MKIEELAKQIAAKQAPQNALSAQTQSGDWRESVASDTGSIAKKGYFLVACTLGVFFLWGAFFPLASAIVSNGRVISLGQNKLIQHPLGGVVRKINAKDGDRLEQGELIFEIDPSDAKAELARLVARHSLLTGQKARLDSGKQEKNKFDVKNASFNFELRGAENFAKKEPAQNKPEDGSAILDNIIDEQQDEYNASTKRYESEVSALENQYKRTEQERDGVALQIRSQTSRVSLLREQLGKMRPLVKSGYVAKARMWELEARLLESQSQLAALKARVESYDATMDETQDKISTRKSQWKQDNAKELSSVLTELAAINEQLDAAKTAVEYSQIKAPVSGTLVNMQAHTIGGVVQPGLTVAEIVPDGQPLLVELRVAPQDIGEIKISQDVEIVVTAFNRRVVDPLEGAIVYVAADSAVDEATGEPYFTVRAKFGELPEGTPAIRTGMLTEVFINTGSRSFFSYLSAPVLESLRKTFNER